MGLVETLTYYPIKGLNGQSISVVKLKPGHGFPFDREFGFARPNSGFDRANPKPLPKSKFLVLAQITSLAELQSVYDETNQTLSINRNGKVSNFDLSQQEDQKAIIDFLCAHLSLTLEQRPELLSAEPHRFTDVSVVSVQMMNAVSIINLESVAEFSKAINQKVDPRRFRANILVSGIPDFKELEMVGKEITIGSVKMKVLMRTKRCAATEVNPATAQRDLSIPSLLYENYGHFDMGVYAEVLEGGSINIGDNADFY